MPSYSGNNTLGWGSSASAGGWAYGGDGSDGDLTVTSNSTWTGTKNYNNLTINSGVTFSYDGSDKTPAIIYVKGTLIVNGTLSVQGKGSDGSNGGSGGSKSSNCNNASSGSSGTVDRDWETINVPLT